MRLGQMSLLAGCACAMVLTLSACGGSSSSGSTTTGSGSTRTAVVDQVMNSGLHETILVDAQGRSLYYLKGETTTHLLCTSTACLKLWPPLLLAAGATAPTAGSGVSAASLGTVTRQGGKIQVTYDGWPLYTFASDTKAGQVNGNNITFSTGHTWSVINTAGSGGSGSGSTTSGGAGGY